MTFASPWWYWLAWIIGAFLALVGLWLLYRSLLADRARGRRRCPKCWYDMAGAPSLTCPECGRTAGAERQLFRTRRYRRRALGALAIVLVGYCTLRAPALHTGQWTGLIPTSILIVIAPADPPPVPGVPLLSGLPIVNGFTQRQPPTPATLTEFKDRVLADLHSAVWERAQSGRAWRWQTSFFIQRFLSSYNVDISKGVQIPARWPMNEPVPFLLRTPQPLNGMLFGVRTPGGVWRWNTARQGEPLPPPPPGSDHIDAEIGIGLKRGGEVVLFTRSVHLPMTLGGTAADFLTPVTSPEIDAMVLKAINPRIARDADGHWHLVVNDRDDTAEWSRIDFSIGVKLDLEIDGLVLARTEALSSWTRPVWKDWDDWRIEWSPAVDRLFITNPAGEKVLGTEALTRATIRVTSDPLLAARPYLEWPFDKPTTRYWAGRAEIPAQITDHPGARGRQARPRSP